VQAPPALQNPPAPVQVTGTVAASNPDTGQVSIQTPQGEVVVQSAAPLPPGTAVSVQLYMANAAEMANIAVLRQQIKVADTVQQMVPPPTPAPAPPLQAGDTVSAILLQDSPPPAPPPLQNAAQIIDALKDAGVEQPPLPLPVAPDIAQNIMSAPDTLETLQALPQAAQEKIAAFVASPAFLQAVKDLLPPEQFATLPVTQSPPAAPEPGLLKRLISAYLPQIGQRLPDIPPLPAQEETADSSLVLIARAQAGGPAEEPASSAQVFNPGALLPLIEHLAAETPGAPLFRQLITGTAQQQAAILPQNMFQLKIISVTPPGTPGAALPRNALAGEVEGLTPGGMPIIKTPQGQSFVLRLPVAIPVGSRIIFEAEPMTPAQILSGLKSLPKDGPGQAFDPLTADAWPALREAMEAATQAAPALRNSLPAPTPQLAPTALLFLAALRLGTIESWLGQNLQMLRQAGKRDLVDQLTDDFGKISDQSKETLPGGWKMISMPLFHDEQLNQMRFFVRRDPQGGQPGEDGAKPATRFLLNVNLSRMGGLQLDGFIHKKQFDLILRTEEPLQFGIRQELMKKFAAGLAQVSLQGGVSFQARGQGWVTVEMPEGRGTVA